jgi:hypothetical protein
MTMAVKKENAGAERFGANPSKENYRKVVEWVK